MRHHYVLLLVAGALFGSAKTNSMSTDLTPSSTTLADSLTAVKNDVPSVRFLRTTASADEETTANKDGEERCFINCILGIEKMSPRVQSEISSQTWKKWEEKKESPEKVFKKAGLVKANHKLLDDPNFALWRVHTRNVRPLEFEAAVAETLEKYYTARHLYKILSVAKKVDSTKNLANDLQRLQVEGWLARKVSPNEVFEVLDLNRGLNNIFTSPNLLAWSKYLNDFNKNNPDHQTKALDVLLATYKNERAVFNMLEAAKKIPDKVKLELATKWQNQFIERWAKLEYSPDEVFQLLGLDLQLDGLLTNSRMSIWTQYVENVKTEQSKKTEMVDVLLKHYTEPALNKMLEKATGVPSTKELATKLQEQLLESWKVKNLSAKELFTALHLDFDLDPLANLKIWYRYVEDYAENNPAIEAVATMKHFNRDSYLKQVLMNAKDDESFMDMASKLQTEFNKD